MVNDCLLDVSSVTILIHEVESSIFAPVEIWSIYSLNKFGEWFPNFWIIKIFVWGYGRVSEGSQRQVFWRYTFSGPMLIQTFAPTHEESCKYFDCTTGVCMYFSTFIVCIKNELSKHDWQVTYMLDVIKRRHLEARTSVQWLKRHCSVPLALYVGGCVLEWCYRPYMYT